MHMTRAIGLHLRITDSLVQTAQLAHKKGLLVFQTFFMTDDGAVLKIPAQERVAFFKEWRELFKRVYLHCSYRINFSSCRFLEHPVFERELQLAKRCGITHLVLHPGSIEKGFTRQQALQSLAQFLNDMCMREKQIVFILENTVGKESAIGARFEDFIDLHPLLLFPDRIGFCVDTAHAHISGYDLTTQNGFQDFCEIVYKVTQYIPLMLLHLNDTIQQSGVLCDQHALPGMGVLSQEVLKKIMYHDTFKNIPIIIEPSANESIDEAFWAVELVKNW